MSGPGWFDATGPGDNQLVLAQGDTGTGAVSRRQVAEVLVRALLTAEAAGRTFELFATAGNPPQDWPGLFAETAPDQPGSSTGCETLVRCRSMPNRPPCVVTLRQRPLDDESRTI